MPTLMRQEIDEIPQAVTRLLEGSAAIFKQAGAALRDHAPNVVVTVARGSSDHAAHFLKYAIELQLGIPVASLGPSLASIYEAPLHLEHAAAFAVSQSGASPDIVAMTHAARKGGALTMALVNTVPSPLGDAATLAINIQAGPELAVAATKSYVNSAVAGLAILAEWSDDAELRQAVARLPEHFSAALAVDWTGLVDRLKQAESLFILGRGPALAIAAEAALKCKETCELHAEAYSSAEVLHGPVSLVAPRFPIIAFAARDRAESSVSAMATDLAAKGADVYITSDKGLGVNPLGYIATGHPLTDALVLILPFYSFIEQLSRARGFNPDAPVALKKVTETK
ncbi:MAG: SIS domain-containing protein [Allorhizobium sp.]